MNPHALSIYSTNNTRTVRYIPYTYLEFPYRLVYYPHDINMISNAFMTLGTAANSISLEEAWKPLFGAAGDTKYVRVTGGKVDRLRIRERIGEPIQTEIDFKFADMPAANPYASSISGSTYGSEPTSNPYLFSDQSATIGGSQIYALEIDLEYDNRLQDHPYGYYIGSQKLRVLPPGRNPVKFSLTTNWEDFGRLTDILGSSGQGATNAIVVPYGTSHAISLAGCKWETVEVLKQVNKDIIAPKVPGIAQTASIA